MIFVQKTTISPFLKFTFQRTCLILLHTESMTPTLQEKEERHAHFHTTHWSVVARAGDNDSPHFREALEELCHIYWLPIYSFIRKSGHHQDRAKDLTQSFFVFLLSKEILHKADKEKGHFRSFLMKTVTNYLHNEHRKQTATKRGGATQFLSLDQIEADQLMSHAAMSTSDPALAFERQWARALLERVFDLLCKEMSTSNKIDFFDAFQLHLWDDYHSIPYADLAARFDMSLANVKVTAHRIKHRYRFLLRQEIAATLNNPDDVDEEIQHLMKVLRGKE